MNPSDKSPEMDNFLSALAEKMGLGDRRTSILSNICVSCGSPVGFFSDELSKKEYEISGLCEPCQNEIFDSDECDEDYDRDCEDEDF